MRLWHQELLPYLSKQRLQGQHRECCAMRGNGWNRKHSTVNYVWDHRPWKLIGYHIIVMEELREHGVNISEEWATPMYRGKVLGYVDQSEADDWLTTIENMNMMEKVMDNELFYEEHNDSYLWSCLDNLVEKEAFTEQQADEIIYEINNVPEKERGWH